LQARRLHYIKKDADFFASVSLKVRPNTVLETQTKSSARRRAFASFVSSGKNGRFLEKRDCVNAE